MGYVCTSQSKLILDIFKSKVAYNLSMSFQQLCLHNAKESVCHFAVSLAIAKRLTFSWSWR